MSNAGISTGMTMESPTGNVMTAVDHSSTQVINSMHLDYVQKVSFDTYGRRMATCSGDRFVRVWDLTDTGEWTLVAQWQAHRGAVTSLDWAHPEFGSLLATCGSDHDAKIWEERTSNSAGSVSSRWTTKATLTEARRAVSCLEFSPRHWGLKLAVGSADGCVRIYEAIDIMNLAQWPLAATLQAFEGNKLGCTCLSWCTGRFEPPTLVVGGSHLIVYRYSDIARAWQPLMQLPAPNKGDVLDVAWSPNVGRRYHYIASAEDQQLRIYKLNRVMTTTSNASSEGSTDNKGNAKKSESHDDQLSLMSSQTVPANAWRCQWNVTGTVLASSGDSGVVQLWKTNYDGQFQCVSQIQGDLTAVNTGADDTDRS
jgi:nucleoporin SEH1